MNTRQCGSILVTISLILGSVRMAGAAAGSDMVLWSDAPGYEAAVEGHGHSSGLVFTSADYQSLLLVPDQGALAYIFRLKSRDLVTIPRSAVKLEEEGAAVAADARESALGTFEVDKADIHFQADSLEIRLGPKPDLVGEVALPEILARKPGYTRMAAEYQPDRRAIEAIHNISSPVEILVFFGTWCGTCSRRLPLFLKTLEDADNPNLHVRYIAIDENYKEPADLIRSHKVHITPTFIVLVNGTEIGRIDKKPRVTFEDDLAAVLKGVG